MKIPLLLFLFTLIYCEQHRAQNKSALDHLEYSASSRGSSIFIRIDANEIKLNNTSRKIQQKSWNQLESLIAKIDLENLSLLNAPTNERFRDAAATAYLKIHTKKTSYQSSEFDHGNPPEEIAELVEKILALAST